MFGVVLRYVEVFMFALNMGVFPRRWAGICEAELLGKVRSRFR